MGPRMRATIFGVLSVMLLLAVVAVAAVTADTGRAAPLPKLGQKHTTDNIHEAQEAAVDRCRLTPGQVRRRKIWNGRPGVERTVDHDMGDCTPGVRLRASVTSLRGTSLGCDRSNNNPIYGVSTWKHIRALGFSYCHFKTSEGSTYHDPTVVRMAGDARAAGLLVGGYHFAHPCLTSSIAEANLFLSMLHAARLDTPSSAMPVLDVEYGGCASGTATNVWIQSVYNRVRAATHLRMGVYSGNWWLAPHTNCLFKYLPGDTIAWISGYPSAVAPCGRTAIDEHQYTSSGDHGLSGDINRLVHIAFGDLFGGGGAQAAPPQAEHQCRMHSKYVAWFHQYSERQKKKGHLDVYGAARLQSATDHLFKIRNYFTKNHEHGKVNYDCHDDGRVTVRPVTGKPRKVEHPKPSKPKPHAPAKSTHSRAPPYLTVNANPAPSLVAPYIDIITDGATVNSIYRGEDAASILHAHGRHTQAELYRMLGPGIANPPGFSTHELRSDGVAYPVARGTKLGQWQVGFDVNDSDVPGVIAHAHRLGWVVFQPYHAGVEYHHLNFLSRPGPNGRASAAKIKARRDRLPTR